LLPFSALQTKKGRDAESTVEEEVRDNLYLMVKHFREVTGEEPIIMMDNIRIQANVPDKKWECRYGWMEMDDDLTTRIEIPTHSPDINQVVEHSIGAIKSGITDMVFTEVAEHTVYSEVSLMRVCKAVMKKFEKGELFRKGVAHNFAKLPTVLEVIAAEEGEEVWDEKGKLHTGSGGNWPNAEDR
jgi:hypothetical protein